MAKKTYSFWYDETTTCKGYVDAEDLYQAFELIKQAQNGEIAFEDLPGFIEKPKSATIEVDFDSVGEV